MNPLTLIQGKLRDALVGLVDDPVPYAAMVRPTQDAKHGDYQANCAMSLAKTLGKKPRDLAQQIAERIDTADVLQKPEVAGPGFINLRLQSSWLAQRLQELARSERLGVEAARPAQTFVIDFSGPNVAKPMHVGHLRSTIIGDALARLLRFLGHQVITDNHLGDWGTQFGILLYGYRHFVDEKAFADDPVRELARLYVKVRQLMQGGEDEQAHGDPVGDAARLETAKLHAGDPENRRLWQLFMPACLEEIQPRLSPAGCHLRPCVRRKLLQRHAARSRHGSGKAGNRPAQRGSISHFSRRRRTAGLDPKTRRGLHLHDHGPGHHSLPHGALATERDLVCRGRAASPALQDAFRGGPALGLRQRSSSSTSPSARSSAKTANRSRRAKGGPSNWKTCWTKPSSGQPTFWRRAPRSRKKAPFKLTEEERRQISAVVGIGAVKYADLSQNRTTDYKFDFDKMLAMNGNTATYMQYAYARNRSIFRKGGIDPERFRASRRCLAWIRLSSAPWPCSFCASKKRCCLAASEYQPSAITTYLWDLAKAYSGFFQNCPVLKAETAELKESRLFLCDLTARVIAQCLQLLGIRTVERM